MSKDRGYLLPEGDTDVQDMACALVYYPDRDEYRRALTGSLAYLATWIAWERDTEKRGKGAAKAWMRALELTLECMNMACLEELQANVAAILEHLQNSVPCCGDTTTYGDSTIYVTNISPGVGGVPTHYGETAVADWDEWEEYLCHNAHLWVDELVTQAGTIEIALQTGGMSIGLLAAAIVAISFFVVGGFVSIPILMLGVAGLVGGIASDIFETAASDIEAARDDIVCAIIHDTSLADAVEDALSSAVAWNLFYSLVDYDSAKAILYEGGDGTTYLEAETRDDCTCTPTPEDGPIYGMAFVTTNCYVSNDTRQLWFNQGGAAPFWHGIGNLQLTNFTGSAWTTGAGDPDGNDGGLTFTRYVTDPSYRPAENRIYLNFKKVSTQSQGWSGTLQVWAWVSNDSGVTGQWRRCALTEVSSDATITIDEINDTVSISYAPKTGTANHYCQFDVLMYP